ncbi:MAG: hypothetical protein J1F28_02900 [Oscillospiraceae bacterium]|nr:hypothetical protein [Oscillospiraceae bacterium]
MKSETIRLFAKLMEKGYITRAHEPVFYDDSCDAEISAELAVMEQELDFTIYRTNGRLYLLPNPTNELFSQNNKDFQRSVGNERLDELYLLNYMAMFLLYELFGGKGNSLQTRYYIRESDFLDDFTEHCQKAHDEGEKLKNASAQYSLDFLRLADSWLAKRGDDSTSIDTKHGCFKKIIKKFKDEELLYESDGMWKPTVKLNDLMPYFLSQDRISEIHSIIGGTIDACDP